MVIKPQVAVALLASILFLVLTWFLEKLHQPIDPSFLQSHILEFAIKSSKAQLISYILLLVTLFAFVVLLLMRRTEALSIVSSFKKGINETSAVVLALMFWFTFFVFGDYSNSFAYGFIFCLAIIFYFRAKPEHLEAILIKNTKIYYLVGFIYILVYFFMPFLKPLIINNSFHLVSVNSHYAMTVLPGFDFISGTATGLVEHSNYGLSMPLLTAAAYKGLLSLVGPQEGLLVFVVRFYQIVAVVLVGYAVYLLNRKNFFFVLLLLLFVSYCLNTLGGANYHPNQAGIRYIPFLVGVVLLISEVCKGRSRVIPLGIFAAIFIALSPEIGLTLFAGYGAYLTLLKFDPVKPFSSITKTIGLYVILVISVFLLLSNILVQSFYGESSSDLFYFVRLFSSGYGGRVSELSVFAGILIFFGSYSLMRGAALAKNDRISTLTAYQAALGTMILVWMTYYINSMSEWNLWFQGILLILLFAPNIRTSLQKIVRAEFGFKTFYRITAISLIAALVFLSAERHFLSTINYLKNAGSDYSLFQNFYCVDPETESSIKKLNQLKNISNKKDYLLISHLSSEVRLLGFNEKFPWYDPFGEIPKERDLDNIIFWINNSGPRYLISENPSSPLSLSVPNRTNHIEKILEGVTAYTQVKDDSNWLFFERN